MSQTPVLATAPRRKLTKKETEAAERDLRRRMPQLSAVSRNGVFEMIGALYFTWAAGNVPGGPFVPVNVVLRGHNMYVFEGGEAGHRPAGKPRMFFNVKKAVVNDDLGNGTVGLLIIPPLPPHTNVFKLTFDKKQFGWKAFFFKAGTYDPLIHRPYSASSTWFFCGHTHAPPLLDPTNASPPTFTLKPRT